ncbi:MAG TPA: MFS transporter, partial [Polyangiaceae bacterium]
MTAAVVAPAAARPVDDNYRWRVLGVVMLGTVMSALDSSIVNVSLPNMMASFGAGIDDIEWVVTAYMLAFSTFMPLTAWMRDRIGYRVLYIASLGVFTVGSLLCGIAPTLPFLIVARVIQAIGGGAITPTGMALIAEVFPKEERGRALGVWGVGVMVGPALGPTLGGYLTETLGWRSIFNVNLP